ncbi:MAG: prepilin-type N-terminal cleavage/methylation domain-containing protein [Candidatus Acidiferrales bacterium]
MRKIQKGFSLIELLIVVAIILIIAAIAIPNLLRAKMAANEASAVGSVRTINTGAVTYSSTYGAGYPPALSNEGGTIGTTVSCAGAQLIDASLSNATTAATAKSGFYFTYAAGGTAVTVGACTGNPTYTVLATPSVAGSTGQRLFFSDQSGVIRFTTNGTTPTVASSPLQ